MMAIELSVVVPSVNGWSDLEGCLAALEAERAQAGLEVLVVDRVGESLRARMANKPMPVRKVAEIAAQIARASRDQCDPIREVEKLRDGGLISRVLKTLGHGEGSDVFVRSRSVCLADTAITLRERSANNRCAALP